MMFRLVYQFTLGQITAVCIVCSALLLCSFMGSYYYFEAGVAEQNALLGCSAILLFISQCFAVLMFSFGNPTLAKLLERG